MYNSVGRTRGRASAVVTDAVQKARLDAIEVCGDGSRSSAVASGRADILLWGRWCLRRGLAGVDSTL